jgi:hypothetical protein
MIFSLLVSTTVADPTLYLNLRVAGTDSHVIESVTPGQVIPLEIYATMSEGVTSPGFVTCAMGFKSTEGNVSLTGDFSGPQKHPDLFMGNLGSTHFSYDGIGGLDWGGVYPGNSPSGFFYPGTTRTLGVWNNDGDRNDVLLGAIDWTVSSTSMLEGSTLLTAFPLVDYSGNLNYFRFWTNGIQYMFTSTKSSTIVQIGEGVLIGVPEPSSCVLLFLGVVGFWAYRRLKRREIR